MNSRSEDGNDNEDDFVDDCANEDTEVCKCKYKFTSEHPGHGYSNLKKRKHPIIPVVSMKAGMLWGGETRRRRRGMDDRGQPGRT